MHRLLSKSPKSFLSHIAHPIRTLTLKFVAFFCCFFFFWTLGTHCVCGQTFHTVRARGWQACGGTEEKQQQLFRRNDWCLGERVPRIVFFFLINIFICLNYLKQLSWNEKQHDRWSPPAPAECRAFEGLDWHPVAAPGSCRQGRRTCGAQLWRLVVISGGFALRVERCRSTLWLQMVWSFVDLRAKSLAQAICNLMIPPPKNPF